MSGEGKQYDRPNQEVVQQPAPEPKDPEQPEQQPQPAPEPEQPSGG